MNLLYLAVFANENCGRESHHAGSACGKWGRGFGFIVGTRNGEVVLCTSFSFIFLHALAGVFKVRFAFEGQPDYLYAAPLIFVKPR